MYVEDLLLVIRDHVYFSWQSAPPPFDGLLSSDWHRSFLYNVGQHVMAGKQLSTNQAQTILKMIARVRHPLIRQGLIRADELDHMLHAPEYRQPLYESTSVPREVRYLGDNILGFRFKQNDIMKARIAELGTINTTELSGLYKLYRGLPRPQFDWTHRIWLVPVLRHTIGTIVQIINEYRFNADPAVMAYLRLARESRDQPSAFTLVDDIMLGNVCDDPLLAAWITEVSDGVTL